VAREGACCRAGARAAAIDDACVHDNRVEIRTGQGAAAAPTDASPSDDDASGRPTFQTTQQTSQHL
jgi:hypothetical protein